MTTPVWPSILPDYPTGSGYERTPISSKLEFAVDAGASKTRNRATAMPDDVSERYVLETEQNDALKEFWRVTTKRGTIPFLKIEPETGNQRLYEFVRDVGSGDYVNGHLWVQELRLRLLP